VDRRSSVTFSALFLLRIQTAPLLGQPLSERCDFSLPLEPPHNKKDNDND
jgi:hypothetical protein